MPANHRISRPPPLAVDVKEEDESFHCDSNGVLLHRRLPVRITPNGLCGSQDDSIGFIKDFRLEDLSIDHKDRLGQGAGGIVFRGNYANVPIAVKSLRIDSREKRHQLVNELRGLMAVAGKPGLVQLYGAFISKTSEVYVVLELMNLGSLRSLLKFCPDGISEPHVATVFHQVLEGLAFLHGNSILHRDVKPENILINYEGHVKLTDFGISKILSEAGEVVARTFLGTCMYMSPERANGNQYSFSSDIWSLGLVAYELATGSFPLPSMTNFPQLHEALLHKPEPRLPATFSADAQAFVAAQLVRDEGCRASARELLEYPFISQRVERDDLALWLGSREAADAEA